MSEKKNIPVGRLLIIIRQMGIKYLLFRISFEIARKTGLLKRAFPITVAAVKGLTMQQWRSGAMPFFINNRQTYRYSQKAREVTDKDVRRIMSGEIQFFCGEWVEFKRDFSWNTNPENGYEFNGNLHWTKIEDFGEGQGDIKYVWERARFSYLYTIIRNDNASRTDNSGFVLNEILYWIRNTRYNCGPHYKCSQEISIRVLNWIFALYYYRNAETLTEEIFGEIINSIYRQTKHVEGNILFSKIAVRNNHAVTEALCLFTVGVLFPWFPEAFRWRKKGQKYLEEEGLYQIYPDGSYIQHSFNYQRVVMQLFSWALALARDNDIVFSECLMDRLRTMVGFMQSFIDEKTGYVPNWGANDSALLFQFNGCDPLDFRPQLNALSILFGKTIVYDNHELLEDCYWLGCDTGTMVHVGCSKGSECKANETADYDYTADRRHNSFLSGNNYREFPAGGYYIIKSNHASTFIRCTRYRHRPYHADNLHMDIWHDGINIIRDAGTYKYNTDPVYSNFFCGTAGHNTIMIDGFDQMKRGERFVWYGWSDAVFAALNERQGRIEFEGKIKAFTFLKNGIEHYRLVKVYQNNLVWVIHDRISGADGHRFSQMWNISEQFYKTGFKINSRFNGSELSPEKRSVWYSEKYGSKQDAEQIVFNSVQPDIYTVIYHASLEDEINNYL